MAAIFREAKRQGCSPDLSTRLARGDTHASVSSVITAPSASSLITNTDTETIGRLHDKELTRLKSTGQSPRKTWL